MVDTRVGISGIGYYIPQSYYMVEEECRKLGIPQAEIEKQGYRKLHYATGSEQPSTMAAEAAKRALDAASVDARDVDIVIFTQAFVPDYLAYDVSCKIQHLVGAKNSYAFDMRQACNGQIVAMDIARSKILSDESINHVLIASAERGEGFGNRFLAATACFYGEGASAMVVSRGCSTYEVLSTSIMSDGKLSDMLYIPAGGTVMPASHETVEKGLHQFNPRKTGEEHLQAEEKRRALWDYLIETNYSQYKKALAKAKVSTSEITFLVLYNVGLHLASAIAKTVGLPIERTSWQFGKEYGHAGAVDIGLNLRLAREAGMIHAGDLIGVLSMGAGFSWSSAVLRA